MNGDVSPLGLVASLALVGIALLVSWRRGLQLERELVIAAVRAVAQLVAVGYVLLVILSDDAPMILAWLWVALMIGIAATTVGRRAPEVPAATKLAAAAMTLSTVIALGVAFGLGVFPVEPRVIVPVGGMIVGNALGGTVVAARRVVGELSDHRLDVEARLALGQTSDEAARPFIRRALRTALIPQIESTKAVGLISLPGTMTGLILAGVRPVDAVLVQAAVMFLILGSVAINVVVVGLGLTREMFTDDHRLRRVQIVGD